MLHQGQCHCGKVRFSVEGDFTGAIDCNCSYCRMRGGLLGFTARDALKIETPESDISTYTFNAHRIKHRFCPVCGIAPFGIGERPDGAQMAAINLRCLPDIDLESLTITKYDGKSR